MRTVLAAIDLVSWETLIYLLIVAVIKWLDYRNAQRAREVKEAMEKKDTNTQKEMETIKTVTKETRNLVNGSMGVQLQLNAELTRWKADQTKKKEDIEAAEKAELLKSEHARAEVEQAEGRKLTNPET